MFLSLVLAGMLSSSPEVRVNRARAQQADKLRALFAAAKVPYPSPIFLRAFKREGELELWAGPRGQAMTKVHTFKVCAASGELGPKRRRGDGQVPEGRYFIDRFNPRSSFHLSLGLNYPNVEDRAREGPGADLGGDIFIHGGCATVGCLPLTDEGIQLLYVVALDARTAGQRQIPVDVFPLRMDSAGFQQLTAAAGQDAALLDFWTALRATYDSFEKTRRPTARPAIRPGS